MLHLVAVIDGVGLGEGVKDSSGLGKQCASKWFLSFGQTPPQPLHSYKCLQMVPKGRCSPQV